MGLWDAQMLPPAPHDVEGQENWRSCRTITQMKAVLMGEKCLEVRSLLVGRDDGIDVATIMAEVLVLLQQEL